jgi:hypothetical protein
MWNKQTNGVICFPTIRPVANAKSGDGINLTQKIVRG